MMYIFIIVFIICFIVMVLDDDSGSYDGHHDGRPGSYNEISHRKDK